MPFCDQCGAENPVGARFCDQCGAPLLSGPGEAEQSAAHAASAVAGGPVSAGPDSCPHCGAAVIPGQAFCDECGSPLLGPAAGQSAVPPPPMLAGVPDQPSYPPPQPFNLSSEPATEPAPAPVPAAPPPAPPAEPARSTLANVQLLVPHRGVALTMPTADQAVIGRNDPVSKVFPDVDLTPYGGLENGVGRRHVRLYIQQGLMYAEDLQSTNGTFLNGNKLLPGRPRPVSNGDELRVGNMVLRVQI